MPEEYVYIPVWEFVALIFLASCCVLYGLRQGMIFALRWKRTREEVRLAALEARAKIITLERPRRVGGSDT